MDDKVVGRIGPEPEEDPNTGVQMLWDADPADPSKMKIAIGMPYEIGVGLAYVTDSQIEKLVQSKMDLESNGEPFDFERFSYHVDLLKQTREKVRTYFNVPKNEA